MQMAGTFRNKIFNWVNFHSHCVFLQPHLVSNRVKARLHTYTEVMNNCELLGEIKELLVQDFFPQFA
jgi:hypothetical protein